MLVCESSECGATKSPEIHNFGSDNKCKVCKITHEHNSWEEAVSPDAGAHRNSCQSCDGTQAWYQDIGKSYPSFSGGTVYPVGNHGDELIYANEKPKAAVVNNGKNIIVLFADSPCMLVVALYKDGKFVDTKTENISQETSITLDKLGLNADNSDMVKAMIFKDLNSLEPLSVSSWK